LVVGSRFLISFLFELVMVLVPKPVSGVSNFDQQVDRDPD